MRASSGLPVVADNGLVNPMACLGFLYRTLGELSGEEDGSRMRQNLDCRCSPGKLLMTKLGFSAFPKRPSMAEKCGGS